MSNSFSSAMSVLIETKKLPPEANGMRVLLKLLNSLFDLLNNCDPSKALKIDSKSQCDLIFYLELLDSFSFSTSNTIPCLDNLKTSIKCFLSYQIYLNKNFNIDYILTRHYNQDCLENLFSIIRNIGAENGNLLPEVFRKVFSSVLFFNFVKYKRIGNSKNCIDDENVFLELTNNRKKLIRKDLIKKKEILMNK